MATLTTEQFVARARQIHGNKYNYSDVVYVDTLTHVIIKCSSHGEFSQTPCRHIYGQGCPKCGVKKSADFRRKTTTRFIEDAIRVHGEGCYGYSKTNYGKHNKEEVLITCPKHGEFSQTPHEHLAGNGCPECGQENLPQCQPKLTEDFVKEAVAVHGNRYDYSQMVYKNALSKVKIICPKHGIFLKVPNDHLRGQKCRQCGYEERHNNNGFKWKSFMFPDGRIERVQGYEPLTIAYLLSSSIDPDSVKLKQSEKPVIQYEWSGSIHRYFPDCYLTDSNVVVETKSTHTWDFQKDQNQAKIKGALDAGYTMRVIIWDRKKTLKSDIIYERIIQERNNGDLWYSRTP